MRVSKKLRLVMLSVALFMILVLASDIANPRAASAHGTSAYNQESGAVASHPNWMRNLPDTALVSQLSLPGTHDTMALCEFGTYCYDPGNFFILRDITRTQSMSLSDQLNSGIRVLDIRLNYERFSSGFLVDCDAGDDLSECFFRLYHGIMYQDATFEADVLDVVNQFLKDHPSETVLMRVKEEDGDKNPIFGENLNALLDKTKYADSLLKRSCGASNVKLGDEATTLSLKTSLVGTAETTVAVTAAIPASLAASGHIRVQLDDGSYKDVEYTSYVNAASGSAFTIPATNFSSNKATLPSKVLTNGECDARGKIGIINQWVGQNNTPFGIGIWNSSSFPGSQMQNDFSVDTNWDLYDKWVKAKNHFSTAEAGARSKFYLNFLSAGEGSFPYFVASGHSSPFNGAPRLATGLTTPGWDSSYPDFPRTTCVWIFVTICTISFEGTNVLAMNHLNNGSFTRVGIVMADFPGAGLIEAVVNVNVDKNGSHLRLGDPNAPPTAELSLDAYIGDEGSPIAFDATPSTDPNGDPLEFEWDLLGATAECQRSVANGESIKAYQDALQLFADAHPEISIEDLPQAFAASPEGMAAQRALDDSPPILGTASYVCPDDDLFQVKVSVSDGLATVEAVADVSIRNVAPSVTANGGAIDENGVATVSGAISDPGSLDTFEVVIDWGEGSQVSYSYPAGSIAFSEVHQYLDDNPTGTPSDVYPIGVTVTDDDGGVGTANTTVTVNNVAPSASIDAITDEAGNVIGQDVDIALVGLELDMAVSFADVGTLDTHVVAFGWGDGTVNGGPATSPVSDTHAYSDTGTYPVLLIVTDDDTGTVMASDTLEVVDAAGAVADAIEDLTDFVNDPAQNPAAVALVQDALDELNGNGEGKANDGVLDMLEKDNWNAALVKLSKAIELLEEADPSTDVDLSIAVSQLVLSAKSIMVDLLGKAQADATKPEDYQKIADAEALIAEGDQLFADDDAVAAVEAYRTVLTRL